LEAQAIKGGDKEKKRGFSAARFPKEKKKKRGWPGTETDRGKKRKKPQKRRERKGPWKNASIVCERKKKVGGDEIKESII